MKSRLGPFAQSAFAVYWSGGFLSNIGTWLQNVVGSVFVYDRTGSAFAVGLLGFATFAPMLLFSVAGGVIGDRLDRRLIVIVTQSIAFFVASALTILSALGTASEIHVVATAFILQTLWTLAKPAATAMIPALVDRAQLTEAVGLNTLQFQVAQLGGPVLATVLLATSGYTWAFGINAASFLAVVASMVYLYARGLGGRPARSSSALAAGAGASVVGYVRSQTWVAWLLVGVVSTSAATEVVRTLSPVIVTHLGAPSSQTGLLVAAQSVGMITGILSGIPLGRRGLARLAAAAGLGLQLAGLALTSLAPVLVVAGVGAAFIGCGFSLCFPVLTGTLQTEVPDAMRGRLLALHQMSHLGNRPFTALATGAIATAFGVGGACVAGMLLAPIGLAAVRAAWRRLDRVTEPMAAVAEA